MATIPAGIPFTVYQELGGHRSGAGPHQRDSTSKEEANRTDKPPERTVTKRFRRRMQSTASERSSNDSGRADRPALPDPVTDKTQSWKQRERWVGARRCAILRWPRTDPALPPKLLPNRPGTALFPLTFCTRFFINWSFCFLIAPG